MTNKIESKNFTFDHKAFIKEVKEFRKLIGVKRLKKFIDENEK